MKISNHIEVTIIFNFNISLQNARNDIQHLSSQQKANRKSLMYNIKSQASKNPNKFNWFLLCVSKCLNIC